jgi:hypothetical protein
VSEPTVDYVACSKYKVTWEYTTNSISGCLSADPRYFTNEAEAVTFYQGLKKTGKDGTEWHQVNRSSVSLWSIAGWNRHLPTVHIGSPGVET